MNFGFEAKKEESTPPPPKDEWLTKATIKIDRGKVNFNEKDYKKFKVDQLQVIANKTSEFAHKCPECEANKPKIDTLADNLYNLILLPVEEQKSHKKKQQEFVKHLTKVHKLKKKGAYISGITIAVGGLLTQFGNIVKKFGQGEWVIVLLILLIVLIAAFAIGRYFDKKAEREGKVL